MNRLPSISTTGRPPASAVQLEGFNVCFVAGTLGQGGAERQLYLILKALCQAKALPSLLCLEKDGFWASRIKALGVPVIWVGQSRAKLPRLLRIIIQLRKIRPAVVQSQHFYTSVYAAAGARAVGRRGIGAMRSDGANEVRDNGRAGGWLNLHLPRFLAANSRQAIRYAVDHGVRSDRLYYLANVVDTKQFVPARRSSDNGRVRLLSVGRLLPQKRIDRFISVLAQVRKTHPEAYGIVAGAGPLKPELEAKAAALGLLPGGVEFRGSVSEMAPLYREADMFVLTSEYEGTPNVLLEAMASGLPVVATRVGGVPDLVRHGETGFLIDPDDVQGLQTALTHLVVDAQSRQRMGRAARTYIEATHSMELLPEKLLGLYRFVLEGLQQHHP